MEVGYKNDSLQFFVSDQAASYFRVHVVFGHLISGQAVISHVEQLPVDRMSRPLQDAKVVNCGQLVLKSKSKCEFTLSFLEISCKLLALLKHIK